MKLKWHVIHLPYTREWWSTIFLHPINIPKLQLLNIFHVFVIKYLTLLEKINELATWDRLHSIILWNIIRVKSSKQPDPATPRSPSFKIA